MRPDMAKILVERPRKGARRRSRLYRNILREHGDEALPNHEGMARSHSFSAQTKWLNENLAPLVRFLRSRVGRLWNDVHSEIMEHVSFDNAVQQHIMQHLWDYVERHVNIIDGKPVPRIRRGYSGDDELRSMFFVDPRDGILRVSPRGFRRRWGARLEPRKPCFLAIDSCRQIHRIGGIWYEVTIAPVPRDPSEAFDIVHHARVCELSGSLMDACYGGWMYAVKKCQLNKRQIARLRPKLDQLHPGGTPMRDTWQDRRY